LEFLDQWSMEHFDAEVRSIARVTLAGIVTNDPSVFRRSARTDVLAAAILGYQIRRLTERFDRKERDASGWTATTVSPFATAVGLTPATVGARVKTIMNVLDDAEFDWSNYLHSTRAAPRWSPSSASPNTARRPPTATELRGQCGSGCGLCNQIRTEGG